MRLTHKRRIDPLFAMSVGIAAAFVRINREEKEKGKTTQQSIESLKSRWALLFESGKEKVVESKPAG